MNLDKVDSKFDTILEIVKADSKGVVLNKLKKFKYDCVKSVLTDAETGLDIYIAHIEKSIDKLLNDKINELGEMMRPEIKGDVINMLTEARHECVKETIFEIKKGFISLTTHIDKTVDNPYEDQ